MSIIVVLGLVTFTRHVAHIFCYSRALDNQMYAAGVSMARDETASYVSWANSTLVSPW